MKKTFVKIFSMILTVALMVTCFVSCGGDKFEVPAFSEDTIKIGVSGPLTGPASIYGQAVYNGARLAVHEINEQGGLNGVLFSFEMFDDQHNASLVSTGYANLKEKGMQVSLGTVTTGPCLEWAALAAADGLFFLTPSASGDDVPKTGAGYGYQMCFADGNQGQVAAEYVNSLGKSKIGIFYKSDDAYSKGIYDNFIDKLDESIETVVQSFVGDANDFTTQVNALKDCDFIFMPIYYTPASTFMTQAVGKVADNAVYYGCDGFDGIESAEGFDISAIPQAITMLSHFNSKATDGAAKTYVDTYTDTFGADTLNQFGAAAYDCVYAIYNALKASGETVNGSTSVADMTAILKAQFDGDFTYSGVTGTDIKWNADGTVNKAAVAYVIKAANE